MIEKKLKISQIDYQDLISRTIDNTYTDTIALLSSYNKEMRVAVNNWLCQTANEHGVSLYTLCDMFDLDLSSGSTYTNDKHKLMVDYYFRLIPKKGSILNPFPSQD